MQQPPEQTDQPTSTGQPIPMEPGYLTQPGYLVESTGEQQEVSAARPAPAAPPPAGESWVLLSRIKGMPLMDVGTGRRLGTVDQVLLSHDYRYVEAYLVGGGFMQKGQAFPATDATIGVDAITIPLSPGAEGVQDIARIKNLPQAHRLLSMPLLTDTGRVVGKLSDVRINPHSGLVVAYEIRPPNEGLAERLRHVPGRVLPATAVQQHGEDALIITEAQAREYLNGGM